jgi:hypothetical protein
MNADDAMSHLNRNVTGLLAIARAKSDSLSKGIDAESHSINSTYVAKLLSVVRGVFDKATEEPKEYYTIQYDQLVKALAHIRYISFKELTAANNANIDLLIERSDGRPYCIMVPSKGEREKSNMWLTLLSATRLQPEYSACITCDEDVEALNSAEEMDCLYFDDCVYSGTQMAQLLSHAREVCPTQRFYCVPAFWHANNLLPLTDIHPAVSSEVAKRSSTLSRATDFLDPIFWAVYQGQTLTFLQTKQPDSLSFPSFLWKTLNSPFIDPVLSKMYLAELGLFVSIAENCERGEGACPPALYKNRLQTIFRDTFNEPCTSQVLNSLASTALGGRRAKSRRAGSRTKTHPYVVHGGQRRLRARSRSRSRNSAKHTRKSSRQSRNRNSAKRTRKPSRR